MSSTASIVLRASDSASHSPTEITAGATVHVEIEHDQHLYLKLLRPTPGLLLRTSWEYNVLEPPLMLFGFHSVPFYSGRGGANREFFLLGANATGSHEFPVDPNAQDVYHCAASTSCTTYCGAGASSSVGQNEPCTSAPPPAPQWPEENTGWLYASISGHFIPPGVTVTGTVVCDWLHGLEPSPPPQPQMLPPSPPTRLLTTPPLSPSPWLASASFPAPSQPTQLSSSTEASLQRSAGMPAWSFEVTVAVFVGSGLAVAVAALCCLAMICRCCCITRKKHQEVIVSTSETEQGGVGLHDLLGRPITAVDRSLPAETSDS